MDGQMNGGNCITFHANAIGKYKAHDLDPFQ